jgi:membrane protein YdbS with pleckstrin-like domain
MSKLDEVKEVLNTLRVALTIVFGLIVAVTAGFISRYDHNKIDVYFWAGIIIDLLLVVAMVVISYKIKIKTKEIGEL